MLGFYADGRGASCNLILIDGRPSFFVDVGSGAFARLGCFSTQLKKQFHFVPAITAALQKNCREIFARLN
jgi:hypothetical protein